jgi:hypothetical protein
LWEGLLIGASLPVGLLFVALMCNETDLAISGERLVGVVEGTLQPAQVSLWLQAAEEEDKNSNLMG